MNFLISLIVLTICADFKFVINVDKLVIRLPSNGPITKRCVMDFSAGAAWMNGKIMPVSEAKISVFDWGLTRSDITYDVVHVWKGAFFRLDDYLDRFEVSMKKLRLDVGMDRSAIRSALIELVATSGLQSAVFPRSQARTLSSPPRRDRTTRHEGPGEHGSTPR